MPRSFILALGVIIAFAPACSGDETPDSGLGAADAQPRSDASAPPDASAVDAGQASDAGEVDDASAEDAGPWEDASFQDASPADVGFPDASPADAGFPDASPADAGFPDASPADAGFSDAGFPDAGFPDASFPDASFPDASAPDAGGPICDVQVNLPETNAGQVGASGGSVGPDLACAAGSEIIGVAVRVSDQNTSNGGPSAVGFTIVCAPVELGAAGASVGPEATQEAAGTGQFGWTPATQSTITRCPPGWLFAGLDASRGGSDNRFLEVTMTCAELSTSGGTTGNTTDIYLMGSGNEAGTHDTVTCAAGSVVRRLGTRVGAGLDAVSLLCAAPTCAP